MSRPTPQPRLWSYPAVIFMMVWLTISATTKATAMGTKDGGGGTLIEVSTSNYLVLWDLYVADPNRTENLQGDQLTANIPAERMIEFQQFHSYEFLKERLKLWAARAPKLIDLLSLRGYLKGPRSEPLQTSFILTDFYLSEVDELGVPPQIPVKNLRAFPAAHYDGISGQFLLNRKIWNKTGLVSQAAILLHERLRELQPLYSLTNQNLQYLVAMLILRDPKNVSRFEYDDELFSTFYMVGPSVYWYGEKQMAEAQLVQDYCHVQLPQHPEDCAEPAMLDLVRANQEHLAWISRSIDWLRKLFEIAPPQDQPCRQRPDPQACFKKMTYIFEGTESPQKRNLYRHIGETSMREVTFSKFLVNKAQTQGLLTNLDPGSFPVISNGQYNPIHLPSEKYLLDTSTCSRALAFHRDWSAINTHRPPLSCGTLGLEGVGSLRFEEDPNRDLVIEFVADVRTDADGGSELEIKLANDPVTGHGVLVRLRRTGSLEMELEIGLRHKAGRTSYKTFVGLRGFQTYRVRFSRVYQSVQVELHASDGSLKPLHSFSIFTAEMADLGSHAWNFELGNFNTFARSIQLL